MTKYNVSSCSNNSWTVWQDGKKNYYFVHVLGTGRISVMSTYSRGEGILKQTCHRALDTGATRAKVLKAVEQYKAAN